MITSNTARPHLNYYLHRMFITIPILATIIILITTIIPVASIIMSIIVLFINFEWLDPNLSLRGDRAKVNNF